MTTHALMELAGLSSYIEDRDGVMVRVDKAGGCAPATRFEIELWSLLRTAASGTQSVDWQKGRAFHVASGLSAAAYGTQNAARGVHSMACGTGCQALHDRSIVIGHGLSSDHEGQIKIGTLDCWFSPEEHDAEQFSKALTELIKPPGAEAREAVDAGRYRWLRECSAVRSDRTIYISKGVYENGEFRGSIDLSREQLDAAIDAALRAREDSDR